MTLQEKLRNASNWLKQGFGSWIDVTSKYDRTPFEAADELDRLTARIAELEDEIHGVKRYCAWVQESGSSNERIVAQTVSRMLARSPIDAQIAKEQK